jgi:DNA-binding response OmpR family regulator
MNSVWHNDDYIISKSLDVYLTKIRKLIKADPALQIENLYGTGYMISLKK